MFIFKLDAAHATPRGFCGANDASFARFLTLLFFVIFSVLSGIEVFYCSRHRSRVIHFNVWIMHTLTTYLLAYGVVKRKAMLVMLAVIFQIIACLIAFFVAWYHLAYSLDWFDWRSYYYYYSWDYDYSDYCRETRDFFMYWQVTGYALAALFFIYFFAGIFTAFLFKRIHEDIGGGATQLKSSNSGSRSGV
ncbi:hypothetical protein PFISCL1PPCAC_20585 [Pristionchus fissidentatus]|uniref:G protein-coupled receptor n=1 Tax=Pristionchus fissidentatus TaxID=1538716 RepID=A0AAV5WF19_9BILA|nr:hypothetical protein PFISCL1PPCAC_20585 [Pristionchus fissidentatus]